MRCMQKVLNMLEEVLKPSSLPTWRKPPRHDMRPCVAAAPMLQLSMPLPRLGLVCDVRRLSWCRRGLQEPDTEVMSDMLEAVEEMVEMLEPALLPVDKLGAMVDKLAGILADSSKRRAERLKRLEGEDFDEDEALAIEVRCASWTSLPALFAVLWATWLRRAQKT